MNQKQIVWSYGGGVQSVAIAVLIASGQLPAPDIAVIADTSYEAETTWAYLDEHVRPLLEGCGVNIEIASHDLATVDLVNKDGKILIPVVTSHAVGTVKLGRLPQYCSTEWKTRVVRRWLKNRGVTECEMWLGFSSDEWTRAKDADVKWITNRFPLLDGNITRNACEKLIAEAGLPPAPKSSCCMCPWRGPTERYALTDADMARAREIERKLQQIDPTVRLWIEEQTTPLFDERVQVCDPGAGCWT